MFIQNNMISKVLRYLYMYFLYCLQAWKGYERKDVYKIEFRDEHFFLLHILYLGSKANDRNIDQKHVCQLFLLIWAGKNCALELTFDITKFLSQDITIQISALVKSYLKQSSNNLKKFIYDLLNGNENNKKESIKSPKIFV